MASFRTLRTALLIQFWFNLLFTGVGGLGILAAVLIPNLLAAREQAQQAASLAGMSSAGRVGPAEIGLLLLIGVPALAVIGALVALPLVILRGMGRGRDMTTLLWVNAILNITNFPVGTVLAIVQMVQINDPELRFKIRQGQATAAA